MMNNLFHYYFKLRGSQRLVNLVIKPTYRCTANCLFCEYRKDLASTIFQKKDKVSLERWIETIKQARKLGAENLVVSGGEPLLYKNLDSILRTAKDLKMNVGMNTNGSLIKNQEKAVELRNSGLDFANISIDSYDPEVHDNVRRLPGLWKRATDSIGFLQNAGVKVTVHTIISKHQYKDIDRLLELCIRLGVSQLDVCHVEADHENRHMLMSVEQIHDFKTNYLPKIVRLINDSNLIPKHNKEKLIFGFSTLFPDDDAGIKNFSQGYYGSHNIPLRNKPCLIPYYFALILEDGSVLPCNAVEYTHKETVGNILDNDFSQIWISEKFDNFRKNRMAWCKTCPMQQHRQLPLVKPHQENN